MIEKNIFTENIKKNGLKLFLWLFIIVVVAFITLFFAGYYGALKPFSFLPEIDTDYLNSLPVASDRIEIKAKSYSLSVDNMGGIRICDLNGMPMMSKLVYYSSHEGLNEKWGLDDPSVSLSSDSTISVSGKGSSGAIVTILLTVPKEGASLDVKIKTTYSSQSLIHRESLVAAFVVPVSEVYCKNGQIASEALDSEYWLHNQGAKFGTGNQSVLIYNTSELSSLQLDVKRNILFLNLDYSMDHPHIYIPYQEESGTHGSWEDQSMADFSPGQERTNSFSIQFNYLPEEIPRLMLVPYGYLAGYIFTEHADGGNIGSHRAVYFGSDTIKKIENATGGFAGNRIPVTKSIFYADPEGVNHFSIRSDPDYPQYLDFLDQLKNSGLYEICLHTPDNATSGRPLLEEAVSFMKERFNTVTWIDHGMYGGKLNRETFVGDGLNQNSDNYSADIWEKYDTRYFWNSAVELIREESWETSPKKQLKKLKLFSASVDFWRQYLASYEMSKMGLFKSLSELRRRYSYHEELNTLKPAKGNSYPTPLYWQHLSRTRHFYSWNTDYSYENLSRKLWSKEAESYYKMELRNLDKLIDDHGIYISHGYYIRNLPGEDVTKEINGRIFLNQYFENILEYMAVKRDSGDLYITTIRDLMDYWIMTERISFRYLPDNVICVYNNNDKPIKGLSLAVKSAEILVNGKKPKQRRAGDDTIFWFDIDPGASAFLNIEEKK
jgi:hypothetical protein